MMAIDARVLSGGEEEGSYPNKALLRLPGGEGLVGRRKGQALEGQGEDRRT